MVLNCLRRILTVLIVGLVVTLGPQASAAAQPLSPPAPASEEQPPGESTTYGFDATCDEFHDVLSEIPFVGGYAGDVVSAVCKAGNAASHPGRAVDATTSKLWDSALGELTEGLLDGLGDALALSTAWARVPNDPILAGPSGDGQTLWASIDDYTRQLQTWLLAFSIAISALRIGIARHHMATEHAEEAFRMLARSTLTTWVAGAAILAAARMTDTLSAWIIDEATEGNSRDAFELLVHTERFGQYGPGLVLIVAIVGILGALAMTVLTMLRQALLIVAVGVYPLTAAASGTSGGQQAFQKLGAWIIAFLLFKPVAALVYLVAFTTAGEANTEFETADDYSFDTAHRGMVGIVLLCSVAFVLPALIRLVTPAVAAVGTGGSGAIAASAALGAGAALATGGKSLLMSSGAVTGGAGSAGFVTQRGATTTATGHRGAGGTTPRADAPGPGPRPSSGPHGTGPGRASPAAASGSQGAGRKTMHTAAAASGAGRSIDRIEHDIAGDRIPPSEGPPPPGSPALGPHHIPK